MVAIAFFVAIFPLTFVVLFNAAEDTVAVPLVISPLAIVIGLCLIVVIDAMALLHAFGE